MFETAWHFNALKLGTMGALTLIDGRSTQDPSAIGDTVSTRNPPPTKRAYRESGKPLICMVPEAGIEPARPYERGILSPMRLPVSPFGR